MKYLSAAISLLVSVSFSVGIYKVSQLSLPAGLAIAFFLISGLIKNLDSRKE